MSNTDSANITKNTRCRSENVVWRDINFVRLVGKRVIELLRAGHGLYKERDGKATAFRIVRDELGICREAISMALRCLDLVHIRDKQFINMRVKLKADLTKYGVGIAGDTVGVGGLRASGVFDALCEKYRIEQKTLLYYGAAVTYARDLVDLKRELAEIDAANPIDSIVDFGDSLAVHISNKVGKGVSASVLNSKPTKDAPDIDDEDEDTSDDEDEADDEAQAPATAPAAVARVKRKYVRKNKAPVTSPASPAPSMRVKRKYVRKDKNAAPLNKHAVIGAVPKSGEWTGVAILNVSVSLTRKGGIATLTVGSVDSNGVNTSIVIKDSVKNYEGIDMAAMVHAISNTVRTAARK